MTPAENQGWLKAPPPEPAVQVRRHAKMEEIEIRARLEQALMDAEATYGDDHPAVVAPLAALGRMLHATGHVLDAVPLFERAVMIREQASGSRHPDVADLLWDLASAKALADPADALPLFERARHIDETVYGTDHPRMAVHFSSMGMVLYDLGRSAEALPLLKRAAALQERAHGAVSFEVATALSNLALVVRALGPPQEAEQLAARAIAIVEECHRRRA